MNETRQSWFVFELRGDRYALRSDLVRELIAPQDVCAIPLAPPAVRGLVHLRGRVFPSVDLLSLMGLGTNSPTDRPQVVVDLGGESLSFLVDAFHDVVQLDLSLIHSVPDTLPSQCRTLIQGLYDDGTSSVLLLDDQAIAAQIQHLHSTDPLVTSIAN